MLCFHKTNFPIFCRWVAYFNNQQSLQKIHVVKSFLPPAQRRGQVMLLSFFFLQTISSSQLLLVFYLCHHDIVTDFVPLGTPLTWGPLIPGDPSYLGFLLPRDSSYLGTLFTFFQSSSFFEFFTSVTMIKWLIQFWWVTFWLSAKILMILILCLNLRVLA